MLLDHFACCYEAKSPINGKACNILLSKKLVKPKNVINIVERPSQIMNSAQFSRLYLNICAGWTTLFCAMKRKAGNILLSKNFVKSKNFFSDFVLEINFVMMGKKNSNFFFRFSLHLRFLKIVLIKK